MTKRTFTFYLSQIRHDTIRCVNSAKGRKTIALLNAVIATEDVVFLPLD
jgi:hypothetical protein